MKMIYFSYKKNKMVGPKDTDRIQIWAKRYLISISTSGVRIVRRPKPEDTVNTPDKVLFDRDLTMI